jgi:hypothetical protein
MKACYIADHIYLVINYKFFGDGFNIKQFGTSCCLIPTFSLTTAVELY